MGKKSIRCSWLVLTDSNNDDVTTASVILPVLMFARTGAPKPMEASCRLGKEQTWTSRPNQSPASKFYERNKELPFWNSFLQINKCPTTYEKDIFCVYL